MKWRRIIVPIVILVAVLLALWESSVGKADPGVQSDIPELPVPPPLEGYDPVPRPTIPALKHELTEREALEKAFYFDSLGVEWEQSWSPDKLDEDPDRIAVRLYNSRSEAAKASGRDIWYAPNLETSAGKVWVITIKGIANVSNMMPRMAEDELVSSVTYEFSARTGLLLAVRTNLLTEE